MENSFANALNYVANFKETENGAVALSTTGKAVYDLFAFGGAYRTRDKREKINLFANAFNENPELALKCLFYLRDVRGGQGERQFFRDCFEYVLENQLVSYDVAKNLLNILPEYGRWDDVVYFYNRINKNIDIVIINIISAQLAKDLHTDTKYPSLLAKWLPSENASSKETKQMARSLMRGLELTPRMYRKALSHLRKEINVLERLMSNGEWDKIEFDKIPSRAGYIYSNCFSKREETKDRYREFMTAPKTTVNSSVLYPYEIIRPILYGRNYDEDVIQKYWDNLPDYLSGNRTSAICVVDVSGSMDGDPMTVSVSLGAYCAERLKGAFENLFITFSEKPQVVKLRGQNICEKIENISNASWGFNTNLRAVFNLLFNIALTAKAEDIPDALIIISDMEIDAANRGSDTITDMQDVRSKWHRAGLKMPHLVYWNVNARNNTVLEVGKDITCVSGLSPVTFEMVLNGKSGIEVMLEKLLSKRYEQIKIF